MAAGEPTKDRIFKVFNCTIDRIDDYFEYRCESAQDQAFVHKVLADMEAHIRHIRNENENS